MDKKLKHHEMRALYRITKQRERYGRKTNITIRGRPVPLDTALYYFRRKGISPIDLDKSMELVQAPPTPPGVRCHTPTHEVSEDRPANESSDHCADDNIQNALDAEQVETVVGSASARNPAHRRTFYMHGLRSKSPASTHCPYTKVRMGMLTDLASDSYGFALSAECGTDAAWLAEMSYFAHARHFLGGAPEWAAYAAVFGEDSLVSGLRFKCEAVQLIRSQVHKVAFREQDICNGTVLAIITLAMLEVNSIFSLITARRLMNQAYLGQR